MKLNKVLILSLFVIACADTKEYESLLGMEYGVISRKGFRMVIFIKNVEKYSIDNIARLSYCLGHNRKFSGLEIHSHYYYSTALGTTKPWNNKMLYRIGFKYEDIIVDSNWVGERMLIYGISRGVKSGKLIRIPEDQYKKSYQCPDKEGSE